MISGFQRYTRKLTLALAVMAAAAAFVVSGARVARAQELRDQPAPFTAWLDFQALSRPNPPRLSLPIWLESVISDKVPATTIEPEQTYYRIRLRRMGALNRELYLRVFFDDAATDWPVVTGWTETGVLVYAPPALGTGTGLPTSAILQVPVDGVDYIDITAPGDGSGIRGAFLSTLTRTELTTTLDFPGSPDVIDPFGNAPQTSTPGDDLYLYGRIRATLATETVKMAPGHPEEFEVQLDKQPLMAVLTFEVLNGDPALPPELTVNQRPLGPVSIQLPDLADPGFHGTVVALQADMRFHYAGWLRCQKLIPASLLHSGSNVLSLACPGAAGSLGVAVRAVEIQLKHNWNGLDYSVQP